MKLLANQKTTAFFPQSASFNRSTGNNAFDLSVAKQKANEVLASKSVVQSNRDRVNQSQLTIIDPTIGLKPIRPLPPGLQPAPIKPKPGIPDLRPLPPSLNPDYAKWKAELMKKQREITRLRMLSIKDKQMYDKLKKECDALRNKNIFGDSSSIVNKIGKTHEKFVRQFNFVDIDDLGHGSRLDMGIGENTSKVLALGLGLVAVLGVIGRVE